MDRFARLAVAMLLAAAAQAPALTVTPLDENTVSVVVSSAAATRNEALDIARREAVLASAGRVLLTGDLLKADDLLAKYLATYTASFVNGVEVIEDNFTGGKAQLNSRVFVNYGKLVQDLQEKRFLYRPAYKPMFTVFMEERLDGQRIDQQVGRLLLVNQMKTQDLKGYDGEISDPPFGTDVAADPLLLEAATVSCERRNIEYLVTGRCTTTLRQERKTYYDIFYYYDTVLETKVVRVDTGEILKELTTRGSAADRDRANAIRVAIERAAGAASVQIAEHQREFWPQVIQSKSDYEVLLTGTDDELTRLVSRQVEGLGQNTKISLKKKFDRSAVLSVTTEASREDVLQAIRGCAFPNLTVVREEGKRKFEVQVAG